MRRRDLIKVIAQLAVAWPLAVSATNASGIPRVGYLCFRSPSPADAAFFDSLRGLGWIEGKNVEIERRYASGSTDLLNQFATELVRLKVDMIVACASQSALTAKNVTSTIPVVFASAGDPVGQKLVASLAHPGGNMTGTSFDADPQITTKQIQLLVRTVPNVARVAVLWNPTRPFIRTYWEVAQKAATALGVSFQSEEAADPKDFEPAFEAMVQQRADALIVLSDALMTTNRSILAQLAAKYRIPAMYGHNLYTMAGGLMSYGPSLLDLYRGAAPYVDRILKGGKPADLPVEQPVKFYYIINLKTARTLGLTIPPEALTLADELIE